MASRADGAAQWERRIQIRLARGEAAALGELYDRHSQLVHALAARLVGEEKAAREVVIGVFTHLWQHPEAFDPARYRMGTWLAMETSERAGEHLATGDRDTTSRTTRTCADEQGDPAGLTELARADSALGAMTSGVRTTLHLAHTGGMNYGRAAAELGITEEEALRRLRLGLQLLADATDAAKEDRR